MYYFVYIFILYTNRRNSTVALFIATANKFSCVSPVNTILLIVIVGQLFTACRVFTIKLTGYKMLLHSGIFSVSLLYVISFTLLPD